MSQTTKRALAASLKNLLLKKPLDKITINDIAEDCGINRMTFYYHLKIYMILLSGHALRMPQERLKAIRHMIPGSRGSIRYLRQYRRISRL